MKVLVTGANGYIGRHVVTALLNKGAEVIACDIKTDDVDKRAIHKTFNLFEIQESNVYEFFGSPDVCLHMAWRNGFVHNANTQLGDLSAHFKFLSSMIDGGLKRLAVMGTMHEVGYWEGAVDEETPCNPSSMYGIAKDALRRAMLLYCEERNVILQWLRCYYILGDDKRSNSIFSKLLTAAERGQKKFPFTTGKNKYDFIEVEELANLISEAVMQDRINGIINCSKGNPVSLADIVETFIKDHKLDIELEYGKFPDRIYDSPCEYGDPAKIEQILSKTAK